MKQPHAHQQPHKVISPWALLWMIMCRGLSIVSDFFYEMAFIPKTEIAIALLIGFKRLIIFVLAFVVRNTIRVMWTLYTIVRFILGLLIELTVLLPCVLLFTLYRLASRGQLFYVVKTEVHRAYRIVLFILKRCIILLYTLVVIVPKEVRSIVRYRRTEQLLKEAFCRPSKCAEDKSTTQKIEPASFTIASITAIALSLRPQSLNRLIHQVENSVTSSTIQPSCPNQFVAFISTVDNYLPLLSLCIQRLTEPVYSPTVFLCNAPPFCARIQDCLHSLAPPALQEYPTG